MKTKTLTLILAGSLLLVGTFVGPLLFLRATKRPPMTQERAKTIFTNMTGIPFPEDSSIIGIKDTRGGLVWDGEIGIVVQIPETTMQTIMLGAAPMGDQWMNGPVDEQIGTNCAFIFSDRPTYERRTIVEGYHDHEVVQHEEGYGGGSPEVLELVTDPNILYWAYKRGSESNRRWRRGILFILRPSDSTAWLSVWKR